MDVKLTHGQIRALAWAVENSRFMTKAIVNDPDLKAELAASAAKSQQSAAQALKAIRSAKRATMRRVAALERAPLASEDENDA